MSWKDMLARIHRRIHDYEDRAQAPRFGGLGQGSIVHMPSMLLHPERPLKKQPFRVAEVVLEHGAMIGEHVTILPGVRIGANSWIGANAVVTTDIPAYSIAAGVPARVLKTRAEDGRWRAR